MVRLTRAYNFLILNGPFTLFNGYVTALDVIMSYAWKTLGTLQTGGWRGAVGGSF